MTITTQDTGIAILAYHNGKLAGTFDPEVFYTRVISPKASTTVYHF